MHVDPITTEPNRYIRQQNINALAGFVEQRVSIGDEATLLSYMFASLRGNRVAKMAQMRDAIEGFYARLVTRIVRAPMSGNVERLPILLAAIDGAARGSRRLNPNEIVLNDGLHAHAVLLTPSGSRLRVPADQHVRENHALYLRDRRLMRVDARAIRHTPGRALSYAFKAVVAGSVSYDEGVIVLPRARGELS